MKSVSKIAIVAMLAAQPVFADVTADIGGHQLTFTTDWLTSTGLRLVLDDSAARKIVLRTDGNDFAAVKPMVVSPVQDGWHPVVEIGRDHFRFGFESPW